MSTAAPSELGATPASSAAEGDGRRWVLALLWVLTGLAGVTGLAVTQPWRTDRIALCSVAWALGALVLWWRWSSGNGRQNLLAWLSMGFSLPTILAFAMVVSLAGLTAPWVSMPGQAVGILLGVGFSTLVTLVVVVRRWASLATSAPECLAWPGLALLVAYVPMAFWTSAYGNREIEEWTSMSVGVGAAAWVLAAVATLCTAVLWLQRSRSTPAILGAGLFWVMTISVGVFMVATETTYDAPTSSIPLAVMGGSMITLAVTGWHRFGRESRPARAAGQLVVSVGAAILVLVVSEQVSSEFVGWLAIPTLLGLPLLQLYRDWRRPPPTYPEGANATLYVVVVGCIAVTIGSASDWFISRWESSEALPFSVGPLSELAAFATWSVMTAAYLLVRRQTISWPALLLLCAWWGIGGVLGNESLGRLLDVAPSEGTPRISLVWRVVWIGLPLLALLAKAWRRWQQRRAAERPLDLTRHRPVHRWARAVGLWVLKAVVVALFVATLSPLPSPPWLASIASLGAAPEQRAARVAELTLRMKYLWDTDSRPLSPDDRSAAVVLDRLRERDDRFSAVVEPWEKVQAEGGPSYRYSGDEFKTFLISGRRVGYWDFDAGMSHDVPAQFYAADVSIVVLDLRNPKLWTAKNALAVAEVLLDASVDRKIFVELEHAARRSPRVAPLVFRSKDRGAMEGVDSWRRGLSVKEVVVLTSERTCGASELLIHGLRRHVRVRTVGTPSCGAPYNMAYEDLPDGQALRYVTARYHGPAAPIVPDCRTPEHAAVKPGSTDDPAMMGALHLLELGRCPASP